MRLKASVIIPTYNRKEILSKSILALMDQSASRSDYEVIIIDDGSNDGTAALIEKLQKNYPLTYHYQNNSGRASARNKGIQLAKHEIIIFIDSDIIVNHTFIVAHLKKHADYPAVIVNGLVVNTTDFEDPTSEKLKLTDYSRASFATGNSSVRKTFLYQAGLFDEDFNQYGWEDLELGHRLLALDLKKVKAPKAIGYHYNPPVSLDSLPLMLKKERERGKMAVLFYKKNPLVRTRLTTLYAWPFFLLERLINLGNWPDWPIIDRLLEKLKVQNRTRLFHFVAGFKLIHAYFNGMRAGRRQFFR